MLSGRQRPLADGQAIRVLLESLIRGGAFGDGAEERLTAIRLTHHALCHALSSAWTRAPHPSTATRDQDVSRILLTLHINFVKPAFGQVWTSGG